MNFAARRSIYPAAVVMLAVCSTAGCMAENELVFTPTQYSVEDFYKNSEYFLMSHDG